MAAAMSLAVITFLLAANHSGVLCSMTGFSSINRTTFSDTIASGSPTNSYPKTVEHSWAVHPLALGTAAASKLDAAPPATSETMI